MKKQKHFLLLVTITLLVHHAHGADEPTAWETGWFTFVALTPTNLILKGASGGSGVSIFGPDLKEYMLQHNRPVLKLEFVVVNPTN